MYKQTTNVTTMGFTNDTAHRYAIGHAVATLGLDHEPAVTWDDDYQLQGHLDVSGRHLVLIATRTHDRSPRLLTEDEWNCLRHGLAAA